MSTEDQTKEKKRRNRKKTFHTIETLKARTVEEGDCWIWQGYIAKTGVPEVCHGGDKMWAVRRLILTLRGESVRGNTFLAPSCGNPACVCPDHILKRHIGTHMSVMTKKAAAVASYPERTAKLAEVRRNMPSAKLTMEAVREIRQSGETYRALAQRYGVDKTLIGKVVRGERWRDSANPFAGLMR